MKRTITLLACLFITNVAYGGGGVFEDCRDPVTGLIGEKCTEGYHRSNPEIGFNIGVDEVASIRRSGDDTVIIKFGDGHLEDYHRRPDGTWGKGLWTDPSSGTTLSK